MKRAYIDKKFSAEHMLIIGQAEEIISSYESQGFSLTLRQLFYQFVSKGLLPNQPKEYNRLGGIIADGRMAGHISWMSIEDRTRSLKGQRTYKDPAELLRAAKESYVTDKWKTQAWRPEVWIEKDALTGVISGVCGELGIDYFSCRGYSSHSEQWRAGRRFMDYVNAGQRPIVFHLGDHDPSGLDMTRDNREKLSLFAGVEVQVVRLALNTTQIHQYAPPPNPTKMTDSRATDYVAQFGDSCWELDALSPRIIAQLIRDAVLSIRDEKLWGEALAIELEEQKMIDHMIEEIEDGLE